MPHSPVFVSLRAIGVSSGAVIEGMTGGFGLMVVWVRLESDAIMLSS